jgi:hypothetical protein
MEACGGGWRLSLASWATSSVMELCTGTVCNSDGVMYRYNIAWVICRYNSVGIMYRSNRDGVMYRCTVMESCADITMMELCIGTDITVMKSCTGITVMELCVGIIQYSSYGVLYRNNRSHVQLKECWSHVQV